MKFLAANDIPGLFGTVEPPQGMNFGGSDPVSGFGKFIAFGINLFVVVAGMFLLIYMMWGAFDWIISGGEKERIQKAQSKITNALIGIILVFAVIVVFNVFAGNILKIIKPSEDGSGWQLVLPVLK